MAINNGPEYETPFPMGNDSNLFNQTGKIPDVNAGLLAPGLGVD